MPNYLRKMKTDLIDGKAIYLMYTVDENGEETLQSLNDALGKTITLNFEGEISCVNCGRKTKKSFNQGHCFVCLRSKASCDTCIMSPEKCHFAAGTCREPQWGEENCNIEHVVYLSNTSGLKVGITRHSQIPTRWIDQGAIQAIPLYRVKTRYHSGLYEVKLGNFVSDKTAWQRMLKNQVEAQDMQLAKANLLEQAKELITPLVGELDYEALVDEPAVSIEYPVLEYPEKVKSLNFDKTPEVSGTLMGIKGQYLLLDSGVINLRKFGGYQINWQVS